MDEVFAFMRTLPLFAEVSDELLAEVASRTGQRSVPAGDWLFREGDAADALYIVQSGRLEVLQHDDGRASVIRVLGRGTTVGDLAILTGSPRSRGVRAVWDSDLLSLDRAEFDALLFSEPEVPIRLARAFALQLQADDRPGFVSIEQPWVIALVVRDGTRETVLAPLVRALSRFGRVDALVIPGECTPVDYGQQLDRVERANDIVVLPLSPTEPEAWQEFCLRQADRVVVVFAATPRCAGRWLPT